MDKDKKNDRFDLEDRIMATYQVLDELDNLLYCMEGDYSEDQIMNLVIGIREQSRIRSDRLVKIFELLLKDELIKSY